jgi:hypothetical protein
MRTTWRLCRRLVNSVGIESFADLSESHALSPRGRLRYDMACCMTS